jgi:YidC/Oxa1 family membrane protein insertase
MDKNQAIGLSLIIGILLVFSWLQQPSPEEIEAANAKRDSIDLVEFQKAEAAEQSASLQNKSAQEAANQEVVYENDSVKESAMSSMFGAFGPSATGEEGLVYIENDVLRIGVSRKGGHPAQVELKNYQRSDSSKLILFNPEEIDFDIAFYTASNNSINTTDLFFEPSASSFSVTGTDSSSFTMRANTSNGGYLEFEYILKGGSHNIGFNLNLVDLDQVINRQASTLDLNWKLDVPLQEKSMDAERMATTIYYAFNPEDVDYMSETSDDEEVLPARIDWLAFKQTFFSSILYSKEVLDGPIDLKTVTPDEESGNDTLVRTLSATLGLPLQHTRTEQLAMEFYFGPNHHTSLEKYGRGYEDVIPLGWGIFGWVNEYAIIPVFNVLADTGLGYGIIILILTLLIKMVLFPLTYKAYLSTAKMRVLKPEIDEINKKFEGKEDPMAKQQATMSLYSKAGVNPLGGCLPMVLQMPILIAMFRFFPSSIELRQQPFLWADDLSSYDSIYDLPFEIPFYGDHVSLFTLLMTVSTIIYTRMNSQMTGGGAQMEQMKWMMYLMPIIFLGVFNNYAAGLSYYYFLANVTTFGQQLAIRQFVDDDKIHKKMQEKKKKPKQKSGFQKRLEDMAKQQQAKQKKK